MLRQRLAPRSRLRFRSRSHPLNSGFHLGLRGLQLFQMKFKLFELDNDLLALDAKHPAPQLLDDQLQVLDLLAARTQFLTLFREYVPLALKLRFESSQFSLMRKDQCLKSFSIEPVEVRQRSGIHAHSMPSAELECIHKRRMNKGESHVSIKPRSRGSRSSAAGANQCLRVTSTTAHVSDKRFLPWPEAK